MRVVFGSEEEEVFTDKEASVLVEGTVRAEEGKDDKSCSESKREVLP